VIIVNSKSALHVLHEPRSGFAVRLQQASLNELLQLLQRTTTHSIEMAVSSGHRLAYVHEPLA
jgi:hypothetical protein